MAATKTRPAMESRAPMSKQQRKDLNRKLAASLRAEGLTPNGQVWEVSKSLMAQGLEPKAVARLVRSTLPPAEQDAAIARKATKVTKAEVVQVPTEDEEFSRALEAQVVAEAQAIEDDEPKAVVLSSRAIDVREGRVRRDAKGRLLPA